MSAATLPADFVAFQADANCRHIPAFFLGCVFLMALKCLIQSSFVQNLRFYSTPNSQEDPEDHSEKAPSFITKTTTSTAHARQDRKTLVFILAFCFASASVTYFASLPAFPYNGKGACAFVIAWGGLASQSARLVGLLILFLELRRRGIQKPEFIAMIVGLLLAAASVFVNNAINTGELGLTPFKEQLGALCTRKHKPIPSAISSVIFALMELYTIFRFVAVQTSFNAENRHRSSSIRDASVLKATSLLLLELMVAVPGALDTGMLGEYLPFSIGAVIVLAAFSTTSQGDLPSISTQDTPVTTVDPSNDRRPWSQRTSIFRPASFRLSRWTARSDVAPNPEPQPEPLPDLHRHPFAAPSLSMEQPVSRRQTHDGRHWDRRLTRSSHITVDTLDANSIRNAVVQTAQRSFFSKESLPPIPYSATATRGIPSINSAFEDAEPAVSTPVMAQPRLVLLRNNSSSAIDLLESPVTDDNSRSSPQPRNKQVLRLTPKYTEPEVHVSRFSMSTAVTGTSEGPLSTVSSVATTSAPSSASHASTEFSTTSIPPSPQPSRQQSAIRSKRSKRIQRNTFGTRPQYFRAAGYSNPIQTRLSGGRYSTATAAMGTEESQVVVDNRASAISDSLSPLGQDWPNPPRL